MALHRCSAGRRRASAIPNVAEDLLEAAVLIYLRGLGLTVLRSANVPGIIGRDRPPLTSSPKASSDVNAINIHWSRPSRR